MKTPLRIIAALFLFFQSCGTDQDCSGYACFTPPSPFLFEIVDSSTGENLFTNGTFEIGQVEIRNSSDEEVTFTFIDENDYNVIQINSIGWETRISNILLEIDSEIIFGLYVDAERLTEDCCTFTSYHEVRIENAEFRLDEETGIYRILVE